MFIGCIIICWVETPSTPPFIGQGGVGFTWKVRVDYSCTRIELYLYLPILQDLFNDSLLNRLDCGPPGLNP
jgi:hypothetical protein